MPPPTRYRYNATARGHPHKKRKTSKESKKAEGGVSSGEVDVTSSLVQAAFDQPAVSQESTSSNKANGGFEHAKSVVSVEPELADAVHVPKTAAQKELDRKEKMMQEIMEASNSKWNRKRKKKLEAYIDKKLKKEERLRIFERLAKTQEEVDHLQLQSSSTLGSAKPMTHLQRLAVAEDQEVRRAIDTRDGRQRRRRRTMPVVDENASSSHESSSRSDNSEEINDESSWKGIGDSEDESMGDAVPQTVSATPTTSACQVGSALRRNPDGSVSAPKVVSRRPKPVLGRKRKTQAEDSDMQTSDDEDHNSSSELVSSSSEDSDSSESGSTEESSNEGSDENYDSPDGEKSENSPTAGQKRKRHGGFKEWAQRQLNAVKEPASAPTEENGISDIPTEYYAYLPEHLREKARQVSRCREDGEGGPLEERFVLPDTPFAKHVLAEATRSAGDRPKYVSVDRTESIEASRMLLPIIAEEQAIVETVLLNPITIICGETGSGKTTQVPQFLFEAGFGTPGTDNPGMIGITQPRRVAAMSMASRVAEELNLPANRVSYQIRYDATVSERTSIKFMTDGVLLRELSQDFLLTKYSVIIVDEAHERSMNTDILIGVLSRVIRLREEMWIEGKDGVRPLRLIIMSATLRVTDFAENTTLFATPPPIITVEGRQHPVSVHFNQRTTHDYANEAVKKASKIHARLPPGGILIFLTGQNEVHDVCRKLDKKYGSSILEKKEKLRKEAFEKTGLGGRLKGWIEGKDDVERIDPREGAIETEDLGIEAGSNAQIDDGDENEKAEKDVDALDTDSEGSESEEEVQIIDESDVPMHIVPLYSLLPKEKQMKVFEKPPAGTRLVIVATNVAETSITIPGITYVVDAGRAKQRHYDPQTGIETFRVGWISKASAAQRSGRAGRTGPGHCYRLYSSAFYENHFDRFDEPEILRMPIDGVVLQMKAMHIDAVVNFPFPTPPDRDALRNAEKLLIHLGALEKPQTSTSQLLPYLSKSALRTNSPQITDLGRAMALFPVSPRFSKVLAIGKQQGCLPYVIAMVAAMSVGDPFLREEAIGVNNTQGGDLEHAALEDVAPESDFIRNQDLKEKEERKAKRRAFFQSQAVHAQLGDAKSDVFRILSVVGAYEFGGGGYAFCTEHFVRQKAMEEIHKLRAQLSHIVQANFSGVDAGFSPQMEPPNNTQVLRQLITAGFIDRVAARKDIVDKSLATGKQMASCRNIPYQAIDIDEDVFIHPSSVVFHNSPPEWIVFQEVVRTSKVYVKGVTVINPAWLPSLGPTLCTYSKPLDLPASMKKLGADLKIVTPRFGPRGWQLPNMKL
ncbi:putative ATP-dependent RNA helicase DHR1 [Tulasnella sp. 427]|nr:putative ATP-dependent RNA helicase DHR1 [Tulasnella sp. 427]